MKVALSLQEKLRDLRDEHKLTLQELSGKVDIPVATLQRMESDEDIRVGYQDVTKLAEFYDVSTDYLFDLTENRLHRNVALDRLGLSDAAVDMLKERKLNNRLVSELISHPDAPALFSAMEVYIDRKILPQMNTMNAVYKMAEETIKGQYDVSDTDEHMRILQEAVVDEDEYLRFRITERFSTLVKKLFDAHKKDALPEEQVGVLSDIKDGFDTYLNEKEKVGAQRAKLVLLAKQIGLNISGLEDEELRVLIKVLDNSDLVKKGRRRK